MKIVEVTNRTPDLINQLLEVWESSVLATYLFLSDGEIKSIKEYVSQALNEKFSVLCQMLGYRLLLQHFLVFRSQSV